VSVWRRQPIGTLVTGPTVEPLTATEAKLYLRVTHTAEDALITSFIVAARQWVETYTRRALCTQTWDFKYAGFPDRWQPLVVPRAPLQSVTSITYIDDNEATQTLDTSLYAVRTQAGPTAARGTIEAADSVTMPTLSDAPDLPVIVRAVCGYGNATAVPDGIKAGLYLLLGDLYEQRQVTVVGTIAAKTQTTVERLLAPYRLIEAV
jgi:uncharacterized phiE125 gp8 family phage protein